MVYMYHSFLIHSSADGHLGCFHVCQAPFLCDFSVGYLDWEPEDLVSGPGTTIN